MSIPCNCVSIHTIFTHSCNTSYMKTLKCDMCDFEAQGETFEDWMKAIKAHYGKKHAEFMKLQSERSDEDKKVEMHRWDIENMARFDAAPEDK